MSPCQVAGDRGWSTSLSGTSSVAVHATLVALDVLCVCIYLADALMKIGFMGWARWRKKKAHRIYAFLISALMLDIILFAAGGEL